MDDEAPPRRENIPAKRNRTPRNADQVIAASTDRRRTAVKQAIRTARSVNVFGWCIAAYGLLLPRPYLLVVAALAIVPLAAFTVAARSRGMIAIAARRGDKRPSVTGAAIVCPLILTTRGLVDWRLLDGPVVIAVGLVAGGLLALMSSRLPWQRPLGWLAGVGTTVLATFGAMGLTIAVNGALDRQLLQRYVTTVVQKEVLHGSRSATYRLQLRAWGPIEDDPWETVSQSLFARIGIGQPICVELHPGALGLRWYRFGPCVIDPSFRSGPQPPRFTA